MSLFLHKLLPIFLLPIGVSIVLLLAALFHKSRWLIAFVAVLLWTCSMPFVGDLLLKRLENRFPRMEVEDCPTSDAIVVLSGMLHDTRSARGGVEWNESVDRFEQGVLLAKAHKAPLLIFTGGKLPWANRKDTEGDELRRAAIEHGVPPESIVVTGEVTNTADEARAVHELAATRKLGKIILVTTAWHMPRAEFLFRTTGVPVIPFPTDYVTRFREATTTLDYLPQAGGMLNTETAIRESYGLVYYHLLRWR